MGKIICQEHSSAKNDALSLVASYMVYDTLRYYGAKRGPAIEACKNLFNYIIKASDPPLIAVENYLDKSKTQIERSIAESIINLMS